MEIWKSIEGYENIYEVSNYGRVKTCPGKITFSIRHGKREWKERFLKLKTDRGGYKRVTLYKQKTPKDFLVHRLVAAAFCEKEDFQSIVNHIDGNTGNNYYKNLEWCTFSHNSNHAFMNGLMPSNKKIILIDKLAEVAEEFYSMAEASRYMGKNHGYVSGLLKSGKKENEKYFVKEF